MKRNWRAVILLGLTAGGLALLGHTLGWDRRAELGSLDLRFHLAPAEPPSQTVVHIDIDDRSLETLGRWPWSRDTLAGLIETLHQAGASMIVLDILFPEPQEIRYVDAGAHYHADSVDLIHQADPQPVFDDLRFAEALAGPTPVILPFHGQVVPVSPSEETATALTDLSDSFLAVLRNDPDCSAVESTASLSDRPETLTEDDSARAYLRARARMLLPEFSLSGRADGVDHTVLDIKPPLVLFLRRAAECGFVSFRPDRDGVVRALPLTARSGEDVYPQFALAVAGRALAGEAAWTARARANALVLTAGGQERRIPLDGRSRLLVRWRTGTDRGTEHITALAVADVMRLTRRIEHNRRLARVTQFQLAKALGQQELLALFAEAETLYRRRIERQRQWYGASLYAPADVPVDLQDLRQAEADAEAAIDRAFAEFARELDEFYLAAEPDDPEARKQYRTLTAWRDRLEQIATVNAELAAARDEQLRRLQERIAGRICFVGSTATGAADFVPTPLNARTPGVRVHSSIVQTILSGDYLREAPAWADALVILLAGLVVAGIAMHASALVSLLGTAVLVLGFAAGNIWGVFGGLDVWLVLVAPVAAMVLGVLLVTGYRQLTEEREKRRIRGMFEHAMSPALVEQLLDDPSVAKLGGQRREITSFFADLAGFTPLAESLGPQGTVNLLNGYFDRVADVVQARQGGYLNKFLGDGVFVFFGAPVLQADHARRALLAAADCMTEVRRFAEELARSGNGAAAALSVRIGLADGEAMVGNCGSSRRMDYTAIGDSVNLSARLESANKFFGSSVLVAESTWQAGGGPDLLARCLGRVLVTGQRTPVVLWEVLGRREHASPRDVHRCESFRVAMDMLAARDFSGAEQAFRRHIQAHPDDIPAGIYRDIAGWARSADPDDLADGWATHSGKGVEKILLPET